MTNLFTHLKSRSLDLNKYTHWVSDDKTCVSFALWNLSGELVGFQKYEPNKPKNDSSLEPKCLRYYTYLSKGVDNKVRSLTAFGLDLLDPKQKRLFVVEGVFDAVKLHNLNLNCLALLGSNVGYMKEWLWSLGYEVVPVCEGDKAGDNLLEVSSHGDFVLLNKGKDLGDMSEEEVLKMFNQFL